MNRFPKTLFALAVLVATGCATTSATQAVGGSKADGTVKLSATFTGSKPTYNLFNEDNRQQAVQRCRAWGYGDAEAFGGAETQCIGPVYFFGARGCNSTVVTMTYQCTGSTKGAN